MHYELNDEEKNNCKLVEELVRKFHLSSSDFNEIRQLMNEKMSVGLQSAGAHEKSLKMLPTYVTHTPTGKGT